MSKTEEKHTVRKQASTIVGISLSTHRVRQCIDGDNINHDIEIAVEELKKLEKEGKTSVKDSVLSEHTRNLVNKAYSEIYEVRKTEYDNLKKELKNNKSKANAKKLKELPAFILKTGTLEEQRDYVSKLKYRFSSDASVALSSALDFVIQKLIRVAMINVKAAGKSIIHVKHVLQEGFNDLTVYHLIKDLPCVLENLAESKDEDDSKDSKKTTAFGYYVTDICNEVKKSLIPEDEGYKSIRISQPIRKFCSDVTTQLIARLSPLVKLYIDNAKVKTINAEVIKFIFHFLYLNAGVNPSPMIGFLEAKIKLFNDDKLTKSDKK